MSFFAVKLCTDDPTVSSVLRFEPDILLRAKQEFMKTDSATDLEWVSPLAVVDSN